VRKNDKGFTLTELLIVIVILGVLTGIVVFAVGAFSDRGVKAACSTDKRQVQTAAEAFFAKTGAYPTAMGDLVPLYLRDAPPAPGSAQSTTAGYKVSIAASGGTVTASLNDASNTAC